MTLVLILIVVAIIILSGMLGLYQADRRTYFKIEQLLASNLQEREKKRLKEMKRRLIYPFFK